MKQGWGGGGGGRRETKCPNVQFSKGECVGSPAGGRELLARRGSERRVGLVSLRGEWELLTLTSLLTKQQHGSINRAASDGALQSGALFAIISYRCQRAASHCLLLTRL